MNSIKIDNIVITILENGNITVLRDDIPFATYENKKWTSAKPSEPKPDTRKFIEQLGQHV